jgi:hypothetical protein
MTQMEYVEAPIREHNFFILKPPQGKKRPEPVEVSNFIL